MGLFVCQKCKCVENTALGHWWSKSRPEMYKWTDDNEAFKGNGLCSECMPNEFSDGSGKFREKKWHGRFDKQHIDDYLKEHPSYVVSNDGYIHD